MKNKRCILIVISCFLLCSILLFGIKIKMDFLKIKAEWNCIFLNRKSDFKSFHFSGKIISKNFMEKAYLPYSLTILLDTNIIIPEWGKRCYPEYYEFDSEEKVLKFSVPKDIYNNADLNADVEKKRESDSLYINDKAYELLSTKFLEWIPQ